MKRIFLTVALLCFAVSANAQMLFQRQMELPVPTATDSIASADSLWWAEQPRTSLTLGLSAGVSLFAQEETPFRSTHGYTLQIPLLLRYQMTSHWRLSTGIQYNFYWDPLQYRVNTHWGELAFDTTMHHGTHHAYAFHSYLGIPMVLTWYPFAKEHRLLSVSLDIFAAYAINRYILFQDETVNAYDANTLNIETSRTGDVYLSDNMLPWKLELGITLSTDLLGIIHGVRFYADLLPLYREPVGGQNLYNFGMTVFF